MSGNSLPVEYSEESVNNLLLLVKSFIELLLDRQLIDEAFRERLMQKDNFMQTNHISLSIPMTCAACGRKGFDRLGEDTKCLFCGEELRYNVKDGLDDAIFATLDASRLFGFSVKASDITNNRTFNRIASKSFTAPCTFYVHSRNGSEYKEIDADKVAENGEVTRAHNKVAAQQQQVSRICQIMHIIWDLICAKDPEAGSKMLREFLTIDEDKKQHAYDAIYTPVICEKCHTEQWPCSLFHAQCSVCSEPLPTRLLPGYLLMQRNGSDTDEKFTPKERKIEYLYTLFEALFHCSGFAFGLTTEDLAMNIPEKVERPVIKEGRSACPYCHRPIASRYFLRGFCPYCGKNISESFPG